MKRRISAILSLLMVSTAFSAMTPVSAEVTVDPIVIQAEEVTTLTQNGVVKEMTQSALNGVADFPKYYTASELQPIRGETGNGVKIASWGTTVYSVTLRPTGRGIDSLTYEVDAPVAGEYSLSMHVGTWADNINPTIQVNDDPMEITGAAIPKVVSTNGYAAVFEDVVSATLDLDEGANTITFTTSSAEGFFFDSFTLTLSAPKGVQYFVGSNEVDTISSGNFSATVNHGRYADGDVIIGAIYEDDRLFKAAISDIEDAATATSLSFGQITISAGKSYNFKYFAFSDLTNLKSATAYVPPVAQAIVVQAEEPSAVTQNGVQKVVPLAQNGRDAQGNFLEDSVTNGVGAGDFPMLYGATVEQPTRGETGDGVKIASWGTYVYSVTLRPANGGIDSLTYNVTVPVAGTYSLTMYTGQWSTGSTPSVKVGTSSPVVLSALYKNRADWNLGNPGDNIFFANNVGNITLAEGENTLTFTTNKAFYWDKFELTLNN